MQKPIIFFQSMYWESNPPFRTLLPPLNTRYCIQILHIKYKSLRMLDRNLIVLKLTEQCPPFDERFLHKHHLMEGIDLKLSWQKIKDFCDTRHHNAYLYLKQSG